MTPERLKFLLIECNKRRNGRSVAAQQAAMARFFQVAPITVRRWQKGLTPIPRSVEVVMEIFYAFPEVTSDKVNELLRERDGIVDDVLK